VKFDVAIIGCGIVGAAVAAELSSDRSIVLLEAEMQPGYHSTGRSVAILDRGYGNPVVQALTAASLEPLRRLQSACGSAPLLLPRGVLHVAREDQRAALDGFGERISTPGHRVEYHDGHFAREKVPLLRDGYVVGCAFEPDAQEIDVAALLAALLRQARSRGATLRLEAPIESLRHSMDCWQLAIPGGHFEARSIINAAGAWADELAIRAGGRALGLVPMRRTVCTIPTSQVPLSAEWPFVVDMDEQFYFKQESRRLLLSPADETPLTPCDAWPDDADVALAVERLEAACDLTVTRVGRCWAGLRSFYPDRTPAIGIDPALPDFWWCAGLGGYGIQASLGAAACLAAIMRLAPLPTDLQVNDTCASDFSPARSMDTHN
jgi:D-arginine dehydrogenase